MVANEKFEKHAKIVANMMKMKSLQKNKSSQDSRDVPTSRMSRVLLADGADSNQTKSFKPEFKKMMGGDAKVDPQSKTIIPGKTIELTSFGGDDKFKKS